MKKKAFLLILALLLPLACFRTSAAGEVTDTLTVKVGYWGMPTEDYVSIGTYHWSELEQNLPLHYEAYSFYRAGTDGEYVTVIDSAYGFYLEDLIAYAGVYAGDVQSIQFYTKDQSVGYFTSFTSGELFTTSRYYFEDLSAHIHASYDEDGNFIGWEANEAWEHCTLVRPMLALEDNWAQYEIGTEHTGPDYSSLGTGNRFRLLFGQSHPLETRTNQTAKYTHTVYLTLSGAPSVGQMPELEAELGAHSVQFQVQVGNEALLETLADWLRVNSSDESVLRILSVTVTPDPNYSDLATVEIRYEILREGTATLTAAAGEQVLASTPEVVVLPEPEEPTEPTQSAPPETAPPETTEPPQEPAEAAPSGYAPAETLPDELPEELPDAPPDEPEEEPKAGESVIVLDEALAAQLLAASAQKDPPADAPPQATVVQMAVPAQEEDDMKLWTALGLLLPALLGGLFAAYRYRKERD